MAVTSVMRGAVLRAPGRVEITDLPVPVCEPNEVLVKVEALGPGVCHKGYESCFYRRLENGEWHISDERTYDPDQVYGGKR